MELKSEIKISYHVDYNDLTNFICHHFNNTKYDFCSAEEANNYSSYDYDIKKEKLSEWDLKELEKFKTGEFKHHITEVALTDLCNRDLLKTGLYIIKVYW